MHAPRSSSSELRPLADWYLCKGHRRLWFVPLTLGLMMFIALLLVRESMEDPNTNYQQSRAAVAALAQAAVPDEENGWEDFKKALTARVTYKGTDETNPFYKTDDDVKYFETEDAQTLWKANAQTVELLQSSGLKEHFDMKLDQLIAPNSCPSLLNFREMANLLALDARCQAHAGNHIGAAKSFKAIRALTHNIETSPLLINEMIAAAINDIANEAFGALLLFDTPKIIEDLQAYKEALQPKGDPYERAARCVTYESSISLYRMDSIALGKLPAPPRGIRITTSMAPLWFGADRRCYKSVADETAAALLQHKIPEDTRSIIERHQTGPALITMVAMPSYSRALHAFLETEERSRLAVVAAAFLQYRIKHGRDATSVEQLVPEFLPAAPKGLFHDKNICITTAKPKALKSCTTMDFELYKNRPSVRLYTVGRNGIDDGGSNDSAGPFSSREIADDCIFHVPLAGEKSRK